MNFECFFKNFYGDGFNDLMTLCYRNYYKVLFVYLISINYILGFF